MENKDEINQRGKGAFWKYAGVVATFMVLGALGIQFMNQPETEELSVDNHQKTVFKEEVKQEELPVLKKKKRLFRLHLTKRKLLNLKRKIVTKVF